MRLPGFDYASPATYFVTICTSRRGPVLGEVHDGSVRLGPRGIVVAEILRGISDRPGVALDTSIVMPDHVHAILVLDPEGHGETLSAVVGGFKANVTRRLGGGIWQRGFYDHVVRDDADLERVREYIETNPLRWSLRVQAEGPRAGQVRPLQADGADLG